jgi:hypothetical protein
LTVSRPAGSIDLAVKKYVVRVTFSCPRRGTFTQRLVGPSSGAAVAKAYGAPVKKALMAAGPGCKIVSREIIREGGASRKKRRR